MNRNKALWGKGDFTQLAATMRTSAEALVATYGNLQGLNLLDLGFGESHGLPVAVAAFTEPYALYVAGKVGINPEFYVSPEHRSQGVGA